jgi:hypothetical protein
VKSVRSLREKAKFLAKTPQGEISIDAEEVAVFPDRSWQKLATPMGEMSMVVSPAASFMAAPMGTQDMPSSRKEEAMKELKRDPLLVAQHVDDPKFVFSAGGSAKVGDIEASILDVNADGAEVRWFIDPQSGRILRASWPSTGEDGPAETVADYADWKSIEGISIPFKEIRTRGGVKAASIEVKEVEINPIVDPKLFEKPAGKAGQNSDPRPK